MILLELEHVVKRFRHGARSIEVLCDVTLQIHEREVIAVWGPAHSGRSTLLRVAGGIEAPDGGVARFRGRELSLGGGEIPRGIAYCRPTLRSLEGRLVLDELIGAQLALGIGTACAKARAWQTLERVHAGHCQGRRPCELDRAEEVRVAIARALLQDPSLLLIDEPIKGVDPLERDKILDLLHSLSREGVSVLMTLDRGVGLFGADRALSLGEGRLRGPLAPELAPVVQMPLRVSG
jgi:ABC-type multidrug transport system ATPase subunit